MPGFALYSRRECGQSPAHTVRAMRPFILAFVPPLLLVACAALGCDRKAPEPSSSAQPPSPAQADKPLPGAPGHADPAAASKAEQAKLGAERYGRMCAVCHGPDGKGYAADDAPALSNQAFLGSVSDEFLRRAITNGRTGTTMSAWSSVRGGPLTAPEIEAVVAHLRSWQTQPAPTLDERPLSGDVERGTTLFVRRCQQCHGPRGTGGKNIRIGEPDLLSSASNGFLRLVIREGRKSTPMVGFGEELGEQAVEDLVAYVRSLERSPTPYEPGLSMRPPPLPLGPVPIHAKGPEPRGFAAHPDMTGAAVVHAQLERGARFGILDARAPSDYMEGHIAGAVSVPFYDPSPYLNDLPKNTWLVCYCACPHAESGILAQKLKENGFTKVTVLTEGLPFWMEKGYGTHTGSAP